VREFRSSWQVTIRYLRRREPVGRRSEARRELNGLLLLLRGSVLARVFVSLRKVRSVAANSLVLCCTGICLLLLGCGDSVKNSPRPSPSSSDTRTLKSGKQIRVLTVLMPEQQPPPRTISVFYVTQETIENRRKLQAEVEEIWADFVRDEATRANAEMAIIDASERPEGLSMAFVLRRNVDGTWRRSGGFLPPSDK